MTYEAVILVALLALATGLFITVAGDSRAAPLRQVMQLYLWLVGGMYFTWFWSHGRQTLPMKTWRLAAVDDRGHQLTERQAALRYVLASLGTIALGATFIWALVDPQRLYLHDRLARTRLVRTARLP